MASYKDSSVYERQVKRGQVWTSQRKLCKINHISTKDIKRILNMFVIDGKIGVKYFSQGILITILNYDKFQAFSVESTEESTEGRHSRNNKELNNNFLKNEKEKGRRPYFPPPDSFED